MRSYFTMILHLGLLVALPAGSVAAPFTVQVGLQDSIAYHRETVGDRIFPSQSCRSLHIQAAIGCLRQWINRSSVFSCPGQTDVTFSADQPNLREDIADITRLLYAVLYRPGLLTAEGYETFLDDEQSLSILMRNFLWGCGSSRYHLTDLIEAALILGKPKALGILSEGRFYLGKIPEYATRSRSLEEANLLMTILRTDTLPDPVQDLELIFQNPDLLRIVVDFNRTSGQPRRGVRVLENVAEAALILGKKEALQILLEDSALFALGTPSPAVTLHRPTQVLPDAPGGVLPAPGHPEVQAKLQELFDVVTSSRDGTDIAVERSVVLHPFWVSIFFNHLDCAELFMNGRPAILFDTSLPAVRAIVSSLEGKTQLLDLRQRLGWQINLPLVGSPRGLSGLSMPPMKRARSTEALLYLQSSKLRTRRTHSLQF